MAVPTIQVTIGGSAAILALYVILTALVVYNSKKCGYCNQRLVICNYLIALCSFRTAIFALRLASAVMDTWSEIPFWMSYIILPGATFCLAEAGAQLVFDWHSHDLSFPDIPRSQRLGWAVTRHLWLSIAFVLAMFNILTRGYLPVGYVASGLFWVTAATIAIGAVWIWARRRRANPQSVGVGALLFSLAFALALAGQSVFILLLAFGRYRPVEDGQRFPLLETGVVVLNVVPDLLVLLPAIALDMGDLDALRPFRFSWHKGVPAAEVVELRRRRTPPPPPSRPEPAGTHHHTYSGVSRAVV